MAESQYSKYILKEPREQIERNGRIVFNGCLVKPQKMGTNCQFLYSIVTKAHVNEETPHIHDFPIIMSFLGVNPKDIWDFDAEIEFYLGGEKQTITCASVVSVPAGLSHCPLIFKRVGKPITFIEVMLTHEYSRREVQIK